MPIRRLLAPILALALHACAVPVDEASFLRPSKAPWPSHEIDPSYRIEAVALTQHDGNVSHGLWLHSPRPRGTVLFFQGNGETVDREGAMRLWHFRQLGLDAYVFDRRGYGQTPGRPTVALLRADALDAFDFVRARTSGPLIVHGFSLGSTIAAEVARVRRPELLVLEGATSNVDDYMDVHLPWYGRVFARVQIADGLKAVNPAEAIKAYAGPLLVAVGEKDPDTVPALAHKLFAAATSPKKELLVVPGAGHWALITTAGFTAYREFLTRHLGT